MAEKKAEPAAESGEQPAPAKSKKLLILIIAGVLILAIAAGGAFLLLKPKQTDENADSDETAAESSQAKKKEKKKDEHPPIFVNLEPFTVNLVPETGDQYLRISISAEIEDAHGEGSFKANMPKIRNAITLLLSSKKPSELASREGKEKLALELKDAINEVLEPQPAPKKTKKGEKAKPVEIEGPAITVLFTEFIIQ